MKNTSEKVQANLSNYTKQKKRVFELSAKERGEKNSLNKEARSLSENIEAFKTVIERDETEIDGYRNTLERDRKELEEVKAHISVFVLEPQNLKDEINEMRKELSAIKEDEDVRTGKMAEEQQALQEELNNTNAFGLPEQKGYEAEIDRLKVEMEGYKFFEFKKKNVVKEEIDRLKKELDLVVVTRLEKRKQLSEKIDLITTQLEDIHASVQKKVTVLELELTHKNDELEAFRNKRLPEYRRLLERREALLSSIEESTGVIDMLETKMDAEYKEYVLMRNKISALRMQADQYSYISGTKKKLSVNAKIYTSFGRFAMNDQGPLKWRVLAVEDDTALVICENLLGYSIFNPDTKNITWSESKLCRWLNTVFLMNTFTEEEREMILQVTNVTKGTTGIESLDMRRSTLNYYNESEDRIFLLSYDEAKKYFLCDEDRIAEFSTGKASWWWLRTPGEYQNKAMFVDSFGNINENGLAGSENGLCAIRPAMWIRMELAEFE